MVKDISKLIGKKVRYFDYNGFERYGSIVAIEPYPKDDSVVYLYISDDDIDYNIHNDIVFGVLVNYADIRTSIEVCLVE